MVIGNYNIFLKDRWFLLWGFSSVGVLQYLKEKVKKWISGVAFTSICVRTYVFPIYRMVTKIMVYNLAYPYMALGK